jgi:transposase-like protein
MKLTHATDRPTERSALTAWYEEALADQEASGLSVAAYAVKIGVTPATLYQWRRRLARDRGSDKAATGLVRVRVARNIMQGEEEHAARLIVRLSRGRSIEIPAGFEAEELVRVIEVLEAC